MHRRPAHQGGAAPELVVSVVLRVAAPDVGGVRHVDGDRHGRLEDVCRCPGAGEVPDLLLDDRERRDVARSPAFGRDAARHLERHVAPDSVVERARRDPVVAQLDRRAGHERSIACANRGACIRGVARSHIDIDIVEFERPSLLAAFPLVLARADHGGERTVLRQKLDTLAEQHVRVEAAQLADGDQAVVACVRRDERDLVDVPDDREQRTSGGSGHADPRRAEHVTGNVAEGARCLAPCLGSGPLLTGGTRRGEKAFERLGDRHRARTLPLPR